MMRNRRPLNPEHYQPNLPMGGLIRKRIRRLFTTLGLLVTAQILVLWAAEPLSFFDAVWLTMTTLVTVGYGDYAPVTAVGRISTIALMFLGSITLDRKSTRLNSSHVR